MSNQENRCLDIPTQKLLFESGSEREEAPGKAAYWMQSMTDQGIKYNQSLHEGSGLSRQYADKTLQVECGQHVNPSDNAYTLIAHKGNIGIDASKGHILISASQITLDASDIVIKGSSIKIGEDGTSNIDLVASNINVSPNCGNIGVHLKICNKFKALSTSYVQGEMDKLVSGVSKASTGGLV